MNRSKKKRQKNAQEKEFLNSLGLENKKETGRWVGFRRCSYLSGKDKEKNRNSKINKRQAYNLRMSAF